MLHTSYIVHKKVKKKADSQPIPLAAPPSKPKAMGAKTPQQGAKAQGKVGRHTFGRPSIRLHLSAAHSACTEEDTEQAVMCRMMQRVPRAGNCSTPMFFTRMQPIMATISGCWMRMVSLREALRDIGL